MCIRDSVIGDYSFDMPLKIGDKLIFKDMAQYTMVKNTTFNGINLPNIAHLRHNKEIEITKEFGYEDYAQRVGAKSGLTIGL